MPTRFLRPYLLLLLMCQLPFSGSAQEDEDADAQSFLQHRLNIEVEQEEVPAGNGKIGLRLKVKVTSKEHLVIYRNLKMQAIVSGRYGGPKKRLRSRKERMVLNQTRTFDLSPGEAFTFESDVMESGRGNPEHPHYGVFYEGYAVVVEDRLGNVVASDSNFAPLTTRFPNIRHVAQGEDFKAHVLVNR